MPEIPERRSEIVPARLARKVAPLFGVAWPAGPFGDRTWVSDYAKITLTELARGAPLPSRKGTDKIGTKEDTAAHLISEGETTSEDNWRIVDRIGVAAASSPLPHQIANATLNRFGPDTKAAVILTAVNVLLHPVTDAIREALPLLVDSEGKPLPAELRLAAWAGLVLEVFRSQPALTAAGIRARTIQRELVPAWRLPRSPLAHSLRLTRCEVDSDESEQTGQASTQPQSLDFVDETFLALRLPYSSGTASEGDDTELMVRDLSVRLRHDETVGLLLRQLLGTGIGKDASHLWLSERATDQLVVEALIPPTTLVAVFVRQATQAARTQHNTPEAATPYVLPAIPSVGRFTQLNPLARRAALIALLTVLRHIQLSPAGRDATRKTIIPVLDELAELARASLAGDDPVSALTQCRVADMKLQTLRTDLRNDLSGTLTDLLAQVDKCENLLRRGVLDRGAAAEAISSACVEINAVCRTNATRECSGLPDPAELRKWLTHAWQVFHEALEIEPRASTRVPTSQLIEQVGYHLHNFAAFLAGAPSTGAEVLRAAELFRDVVIPSRQRFFDSTGSFQPLRHALQAGSRATTRLAESARAEGDEKAAVEWAELGHNWISQALEDPHSQRLLEASQPTESVARLALLAAPALLLAVEIRAPSADARDIIKAGHLLELVQRWERDSLPEPHLYSRHAEVVALQHRLDTVLAVGHSRPGAA